jgi:hypothetical protein
MAPRSGKAQARAVDHASGQPLGLQRAQGAQRGGDLHDSRSGDTVFAPS